MVPTTDQLASTLADVASTRFKICRYTPVSGCDPLVGAAIWGRSGAVATCVAPNPQTDPPTPSRLMANVDHPYDYVDVTGPLTNQNFLVIRAGDGSAAFSCPGDDATTPLVNGNTWRHEPRT